VKSGRSGQSSELSAPSAKSVSLWKREELVSGRRDEEKGECREKKHKPKKKRGNLQKGVGLGWVRDNFLDGVTQQVFQNVINEELDEEEEDDLERGETINSQTNKYNKRKGSTMSNGKEIWQQLVLYCRHCKKGERVS
jgi:hypothetical protein